MASKVELVNRALSKIGQRPIASIDEDSASAKAALLVYDSVRREVLSSYSWAFAVRTVKLAIHRPAGLPLCICTARRLPPRDKGDSAGHLQMPGRAGQPCIHCPWQ